MKYHYTAADCERWGQEPPKGALLEGSRPDSRSPFAHDRDRVLHSAALRRLADKTQVVGPSQGDIPRNRLTHSLEVAQIARGMGSGLGLDPDLCELAGLTHDIGHPPYGHNGETILNELAAECGGFEGNAQTLRILTRLEPKVLDPQGRSLGLNLTRASLDAACKYPWVGDSTTRKYSCYAEDREVFEWIRTGAPSSACMEAQVMDWADDVAYSVHDVEDGIISGCINFHVLWDLVELSSIAERGASHFGGSPEQLLEAASRLNKLEIVSACLDCDRSLSGLVALKQLTSQLVGRFVGATIAASRQAQEEAMAAGECGRHNGSLIIPESVQAEVRLLKTMAVLYVMDKPEHQKIQERQRDRIATVFDYMMRGAPGTLDPVFGAWFMQAESEAARQRVIIDQIASLTESRLERIAHYGAAYVAPLS